MLASSFWIAGATESRLTTRFATECQAMLVLSRKKNESIIINDHITVTVVEIRGDKVRLGIEAPKDISVHRREIYEAIQNQQMKTRDGSNSAPIAPETKLN